MYTPRTFKNENLGELHALIRSYSFGIVFSQATGSADSAIATHLPFLLDTERGPNGTLIAHFARANPHWKSWQEDTELLTVFQGPHGYISPAWYTNKTAVPTWNYAAVHVYGRPKLIHDPVELRPLVEKLVSVNEAPLGNQWDQSLMEPLMETELQAIVGFEIPIERIEGKYKFNQNRPLADQRSVVEQLSSSEHPDHKAMVAIMKKNIEQAE